MRKRNRFILGLGLSLATAAAWLSIGMNNIKVTPPARPEGTCDIYAAGGSPCVAAHSSTRALYAAYNGPLYQVMRASDRKTLDIGVVKPSGDDPGGYANAAAQDDFCVGTSCWVTVLYDQSGNGNHLTQPPHGGFSGPAMGGFNNLPVADMAPVTVMGHKVYGIFIAPGMGLRLDDAKGTAVDDQAEGQYWVINGRHYNNGCCYDYGNAETDSRDDGDGTMETTYYGNTTPWYHGPGNGPWIMTDQENNLVGCVNPSPNDKGCPLPIINWRFVTAMADGEPHHWRSMGGDAQQGNLQVMFDGTRVTNERNSYDPMRKQGAILLGNGGDNSNGSQGTFYEGAMTAAGTFPTKETNQKVQANVVAARYDVQSLALTPENAVDMPPGLQTFSPGSSQNSTITFTNTTGEPVKDLVLSVGVPAGWKSVVQHQTSASKKISGIIQPGSSVNTTFTITSGNVAFNGDLVGKASWKGTGSNRPATEMTHERVRNVSPVKINEFRVSDGSNDNQTNSFIELYNAGKSDVDISNWTFNYHATQMPAFSAVKIPAGTKLSAHGFYVLGLANSGLAVTAKKGESKLFVRNTVGMSAGDMVTIGTGLDAETRKVISVTSPAPVEAGIPAFGGNRSQGSTLIWQPLPEGPVITIPAGSTNIPVGSTDGFQVGQKMAIGYGAQYPAVAQGMEHYEVVTITNVGKPGTQAYLSTDVKAGSTNIKVSSVANISVGDKIRLDIDSKGHGIETVTVTKVGTASSRGPGRGPFAASEDLGTGLELAEPLRYNHAANMPFSVRGTGISYEPASSYQHLSNEPVLALTSNIVIDRPLSTTHEIDAVIRDQKVTKAGYQGKKQPNQWFGGPVLAAGAGNMNLRDAKGNVVDALNYGALVDPYLAAGYQAKSGTGQGGNFAPAPGGGRGFRPGAPSASVQPDRSTGRFPDGFDDNDNAADFMVQNTSSLAVTAASGANNIKVVSVANLNAGQRLIIGSGSNTEFVRIASVGTPGGTATETAVVAGVNVIPVSSVAGFEAGQSVTIGAGGQLETIVIKSVTVARRGGNRNAGPAMSITVTEPLKFDHPAGTEIAGSGITLSMPLVKAHESGSPLADNTPTPGEPNRYIKKATRR